MRRRILSLLAAFALVISLFPAHAAAVADGGDISQTGLDLSQAMPAEETVYKAGAGTVTVTPASGNNPVVVTMENASITVSQESAYAIKFPETMGDVKLVLVGNNTVTSQEEAWGTVGYYASGVQSGELTISGTGRLTMDVGNTAIRSSGNITVESGTLDITAEGSAISAKGYIVTVTGGDIKARTNSSYSHSIVASKLVMTGGTLKTLMDSQNEDTIDGSVEISGGRIDARNVLGSVTVSGTGTLNLTNRHESTATVYSEYGIGYIRIKDSGSMTAHGIMAVQSFENTSDGEVNVSGFVGDDSGMTAFGNPVFDYDIYPHQLIIWPANPNRRPILIPEGQTYTNNAKTTLTYITNEGVIVNNGNMTVYRGVLGGRVINNGDIVVVEGEIGEDLELSGTGKVYVHENVTVPESLRDKVLPMRINLEESHATAESTAVEESGEGWTWVSKWNASAGAADNTLTLRNLNISLVYNSPAAGLDADVSSIELPKQGKTTVVLPAGTTSRISVDNSGLWNSYTAINAGTATAGPKNDGAELVFQGSGRLIISGGNAAISSGGSVVFRDSVRVDVAKSGEGIRARDIFVEDSANVSVKASGRGVFLFGNMKIEKNAKLAIEMQELPETAVDKLDHGIRGEECTIQVDGSLDVKANTTGIYVRQTQKVTDVIIRGSSGTIQVQTRDAAAITVELAYDYEVDMTLEMAQAVFQLNDAQVNDGEINWYDRYFVGVSPTYSYYISFVKEGKKPSLENYVKNLKLSPKSTSGGGSTGGGSTGGGSTGGGSTGGGSTGGGSTGGGSTGGGSTGGGSTGGGSTVTEQPTVPSVSPGAAAGSGSSAPREFKDVKSGAWFYDAVRYAVDNGLFGGVSQDMFDPHGKMTRAMFAKVLHNKEKNPAHGFRGGFDDVKPGQWYTDAIHWAAEKQVVGGYGDGRFGTEDNITREQLAVMLWRYAGSPASSAQLSFADADKISDYALGAVRWAVEQGIINGKSGNILDPRGNATRAEVAQMFRNYMQAG